METSETNGNYKAIEIRVFLLLAVGSHDYPYPILGHVLEKNR